MSELALQLIRENKAAHARGEDVTYLNLGKTGLTYLPDELFDCIWLETLAVSDRYWDRQTGRRVESRRRGKENFLSAIPAGIEKLQNLKVLYLSGDPTSKWQIRHIGFLEKLTQLELLDLSYNQISYGRFLEKLTQLQSLDLSYNQISDLGFLGNLIHLQSLDLSYNQISDGQFLKNLTQLQEVDLRNNQISELSLSLLESLPLELDVENQYGYKRKVSLKGNPLQSPPLDVLRQGRAFAIEYLKNQEKRPLNECKVIIVGRGAVGKTSLQKRLFGQEVFDKNEPETHGIRKRCWQDGVLSGAGQPIKVHFWDFGGQHIQQALHQFFYSRNTLYLLVLDKRKDENPEDFLELIRAYGHEAPVLVVYNHHVDLKHSQRPHYELSPTLDSSLRNKYPTIRRVFGVCCGIENDEGVAQLRQYLQNLIPSLDHVRESSPLAHHQRPTLSPSTGQLHLL